MNQGEALQDELTQMMLKTLHHRGQITAGELADHLDVVKHKIKYRLNEHLIPFKFAERRGKKEMPGSTKDAILYQLTERGEKLVEINPDKLADPITRKEVVETYNEVGTRIDQFQNRAREVENEVDRMDDLLERRGKVISKWKGRIQQNETKLESLESKMRGRRKELEDIQSRLQLLENEISETTDRVGRVQEDLDALDSTLSQKTNDTSERVAEIEKRVRELYEHIDRLNEKIESKGLF